jgi:hypothetical protein
MVRSYLRKKIRIIIQKISISFRGQKQKNIWWKNLHMEKKSLLPSIPDHQSLPIYLLDFSFRFSTIYHSTITH